MKANYLVMHAELPVEHFTREVPPDHLYRAPVSIRQGWKIEKTYRGQVRLAPYCLRIGGFNDGA